MTIRQILCILKFGFLLKYFSKEQIGNWAEKKIMEDCKDVNIIELAFIESKSNNVALTLINAVVGELSLTDIEFINQYYLGFFKEKLISSKSKAEWVLIEAEILKYYSLDDFILNDDEKFFISVLDDDYSLRKDGLSGVMKLPEGILIFLDRFNNFDTMQKQLDKEHISKPQLIFL